MRRRQGWTLIELLVATFLAGIVMLMFATVFQVFRPATSETEFSYLLSAEVEERLERLQMQLSETALGAVVVTPVNGSTPPGISFPSFRDQNGQPVFDESGAPAWQQQIYYYLEGNTLYSWQEAALGKVPAPSTTSPSGAAKNRRTVLQDVVAPNAELPALPELSGYRPGPAGGFQVQYLRRSYDGKGSYSLQGSSSNPAQVSAGQVSGLTCDGNSGLIQLTVQVYKPSPQGKPDYLSISMRVRPRY